MSDQKRWFKVWTSILLDPTMNSLDLADIGRWVRLGALTAAVGTRGTLTFPAPGDGLIHTLKVANLEAAKAALNRLPNVHFEITKNDNNEFSENDNDEFTVTFENWHKYQMDSTGYERLKKYRMKRSKTKTKTKTKNPPKSSQEMSHDMGPKSADPDFERGLAFLHRFGLHPPPELKPPDQES